MRKWSEGRLVWKLIELIFAWARRIIEPKDDEFNSSVDSCVLGFNA